MSWHYQDAFESDVGVEDWILDGQVADTYDFEMLGESDAIAEMTEALRDTLSEDYAGASYESLEEALFSIIDSMSGAEGFNFGKALQQIAKPVTKALSDPAVGQIAATAAPIAGAALGTFAGGPAGMAIGSQVGSAAAKALAPRTAMKGQAGPQTAVPRTQGGPAQSAINGSAAAAQGLVLSQKPEVLQSMLALALGQHGKQTVDGVPTGAVMNMLANLFKQAASDADELQYLTSRAPSYLTDDEGELTGDPAVPAHRAQALYEHWLNAEGIELMSYDVEEFEI